MSCMPQGKGDGRPAAQEGVEANASRVMGMKVTTAGLQLKE